LSDNSSDNQLPYVGIVPLVGFSAVTQGEKCQNEQQSAVTQGEKCQNEQQRSNVNKLYFFLSKSLLKLPKHVLFWRHEEINSL